MAFFYFYQIMIDYIISHQDGIYIYQDNQVIFSKCSTLSWIKALCKQFLITYEGYLKAVSHTIGLKYKIPIFLSDSNIWIQTKRAKDYDNIWVNFAAISKFESQDLGITVHFLSGNKLYLKLSLNSFKAYEKKIKEIAQIRVKHFH